MKRNGRGILISTASSTPCVSLHKERTERTGGLLLQAFWGKIVRSDSCWLWNSTKSVNGYGVFWNGHKGVRAHRFSYELFKGPIPDGLQIDHLCRVRHCVNPLHLEAVTQKENLLRGESFSAINKRKTECNYGHPLSGENLRIWNGRRRCRACVRARRNERKERGSL